VTKKRENTMRRFVRWQKWKEGGGEERAKTKKAFTAVQGCDEKTERQ